MKPLYFFPNIGKCLRVAAIAGASAFLFTNTDKANATLIVDWGGDYVTSDSPLNVGTPTTGSGWITHHYSFTNAINPDGPTFYGAFSLENGSGTGTPAFTFLDLSESAVGDRVRIYATAMSGSLTARGMVFFKKEDFLNGGSNGIVTFDENSSLTINVTSSGGNTRQVRAAVYALVDGEWNWYVSLTTKAGTTSYVFSDLANEEWGLYNINSSMAPLPNALTGSSNYQPFVFDDIGAVGIFFNYVRNTENGALSLYFNSLEVNATVIPEPSSAALVGGVMLSLLLRRAHGKSE